MRILILITACLFLSFQTYSWGPIGHRTVGLVAQKHLSKKAKKKLRDLLKHESLAVASFWMDEQKSNPEYEHTYLWHFVDFPYGKEYSEIDKSPKGDIIQTLNRLIDELEAGNLSKEKEVINIRMLVHLVGDIHQPLHVGNGEDMGGNKVEVKWFGDNTNIHSVWDSKIIDSKKFSYTELAAAIDHFENDTIKEQWQNDGILTWAKESQELHKVVYNLPEDNYLGYEYMYDAWPVIQDRLHKAGVRLAGILNKIYQ